jgi:CIC family chloride channel protein
MLGGALTGVLALVLLHSFGNGSHAGDVLSSGYGIIQAIITGDGTTLTMAVLLAVCAGKILTTSLSIGSGGSGGVFGPSMVIGATLGAVVGKLFHVVMPTVVQHPSTFAIVGMAGFFAAAANTPISTVIMVSELTGNYELLLPAMWVCALAFLVGKRWSIYEKQVSSKLWSPAHSSELADRVFAGAAVAEVFSRTRKFVSLPATASLPEILDATQGTRQRVFPVTDGNGKLVGSFQIDDLTHALHEPAAMQDAISAGELCQSSVLAVRSGERVELAQGLLSQNHVDELLVVEEERPDRVMGILTSADILLAYTRRLSTLRRGGPASVPP